MKQQKSRNVHAAAILGPELYSRLPNTRVLLVGAGGIGCELLKNIVMVGFGDITLLDLDTIDLSNLNRQFLFRKKDVKQSKARVAADTASAFNPHVRINYIHANIKEPEYDISWFRTFDIVLNALDNLDARRHVNKMCMAAQVPLVESGTAGYLGQVQPILKDRTECFDCIPKPTPKTFPVCTIRSTPSQPIHCIVWAKSYLVPQLFGEDEDAAGESELNDALQQGENAQEIDTLRREAQAFRAVRTALRSPNTDSEAAAKLAFEKVFHSDIKNLLSMSDMWRSRAPPTALVYDEIKAGSFVLRDRNATLAPNSHGGDSNQAVTNGTAASSGGGLKDQRTLTLQETLALFVSSTDRLAARLRSNETTISFDKDDDDTLDFVTAASNLRSAAYGIDGKSRWEIKEMAGNIIPAIATTNAIISGLIVLQALQLLRKSYDTLRNVHVQFKPSNPLSTIKLCPPNPHCGICKDTFTEVLCDPSRVTLAEIVNGVLGDEEKREVGIYEDKRILADPEWDDNMDRTLESLNVTRGKFLSIVDDDGDLETISVGISHLPPNHPEDGPAFIMPSSLPKPPKKLKVKRSTPQPAEDQPTPAVSLKRLAPEQDDDDIIIEQPAKRQKTTTDPFTSPSKRKLLEDDGIVMLETADGLTLEDDDDVIVID